MQLDSVPPPDRTRRTQHERREATRKLLLDATVECLVQLGYSGTTTLEVERRAGVSRGARIHHFPTKAALLASAVDHLYLQLSAHYDDAFGSAVVGSSPAERLCSGLRFLWSLYRREQYVAVLELNMAARIDRELQDKLCEVGTHHQALAMAAAARHFPQLPSDIASGLIEGIHTVLIGLLLQLNAVGRLVHEEDVLRMLDAMVLAHLPK
jgi:AcrR family transcriptional regulator